MKTNYLTALILYFTVCTQVYSQFNPSMSEGFRKGSVNPDDVIIWSTQLSEIDRDGTVQIGLSLQTRQGFSLYETKLKFFAPHDNKLESVSLPALKVIADPLSGRNVNVVQNGNIMLVFSGIDPIQKEFEFEAEYIGCTFEVCLFPHTKKFKVKLNKTETLIPRPKNVIEIQTRHSDLKNKSKLNKSLKRRSNELTWIKPKSLKEFENIKLLAKYNKKGILVDHWASWCAACIKMDQTTFKDLKLAKELKKHWVLVKFDLTLDNESNDTILSKFDIAALPTISIIKHRQYDTYQNVTTYISGPNLLSMLLNARK